ncbi:helix-turn-helix domain-containing protein [Streptomyces radicis]|uniref:XRE family transcriptional regulator n=1 Tax=Streptomyces radicis TaxID=1750517 RepID=A0A3A9W6V7_9ACTN|nr:helix-turn-helix transcriptional regulator [Streptomyces radicis]RKN03226.1 XRE family transcriptional regulator [Streptomyces radicis]RKN13112.1 XRE family transcriptional regulator [Streptomyces radicis]
MKPRGSAPEVEDFAAYVRGLKERGGRSYGALARRLNVSASTLHRYCSGEAVPADFALLERFAQLCEATPDERLELHRMWLGATEAREGREREPADPEPADPGPEEPGPTAGRPRSPRRRSRRVAAAVAVGVVAVVVVALAGLMAQDPAGDTEPDPAEVMDPAQDPEPESEPESEPDPEPDPEPPLDWTVDSHVWQSGCSHRYVVDRPADEVPSPPVQQDAREWAEPLGAVHGGETRVRVTVQGRDSAAVVLEALRVRVVERAAPAPGNAFSMSPGCGGSLSPRRFDVDLDADRPLALSRPGGDEGGEIPAVALPYAVSVSEPEVLLVTARTVACDCSWYLELEWSSQGRSGTVRVDDDGRPFRTSGVEGLPAYFYNNADDSWVSDR